MYDTSYIKSAKRANKIKNENYKIKYGAKVYNVYYNQRGDIKNKDIINKIQKEIETFKSIYKQIVF